MSQDTPPLISTPPPDRRQLAVMAVTLVLAVWVAFAGVRHAGFIDLDDDVYVTLNPHVWRGLSGENLVWAFSNVEGANWMPLTWITLQLDAAITGEAGGSPADFERPGYFAKPMRATVYHLQNVAWHAGACVLLLLLVRRLTGRAWAAFAVALLWGVHPLRVESVAWISERKDVLALFWGLLALYAYLRYAENPRRRSWYWGMLAALVLSLMGKALFVTMPALLLLLDYWPLGRWKHRSDLPRLIREKWPVLIVAACAAGVAIFGQAVSGAVKSTAQFPMGERTANALVSVCRYLGMQVRCWELSVFYPWRPPTARETVGACVLLASISIVAWIARKRRPWLLVGWCWFLVALAPVIGMVQIGEQSHADRYTYLPSIGLLVALAMSLPTAAWTTARLPTMTGVSVAAVALIGVTSRQVGYWRDSRGLFTRSIAVTQGNYSLRYNLAIGAMKEQEFAAAERLLREAVELRPEFGKAQAGLGHLYLQQGRFGEALACLTKAADTHPAEPEFLNMKGYALVQLKRYGEAEAVFEAAIATHPQDLRARQNLEAVRELMRGSSLPASAPATSPGP